MWPLSDARIAEREFTRLVVRVPNPLGDQIMATPALEAVRARYPDAYIAGHGTGVAEQLYAGGTFFDDFLRVGRREGARSQARRLRAGRFDACLLLTGSLRTALPPWLARVPHRIGYRWSGRTALLTAHFRRPRPGGRKGAYPTKLFYLDLVERLGARPDRDRPVSLPLSEDDRAAGAAWRARHGVGDGETVLALCVGAAFGPSKIWPADHFAAVADHMVDRHGVRVVLLCGPGEEEHGARVRALARRPVVDTGEAPLSIGALKAVLAGSRALLTNDTGPRHIAAAFGVPVVCVIGPTDPAYSGTDLGGQVVLREGGVECAPCHLKVCPIDHRCLTRIGPERAIRALEDIFSGTEQRSRGGPA